MHHHAATAPVVLLAELVVLPQSIGRERGQAQGSNFVLEESGQPIIHRLRYRYLVAEIINQVLLEG
jgi:hypothetical protein